MHSTSELEAEAALAAAAQSDPTRFTELYRQHVAGVHALAWSRLGDRVAAEDVTAETPRRALRALPRFEFRGVPYGAWLARICINLTNDELRRSPRTAPSPTSLGSWDGRRMRSSSCSGGRSPSSVRSSRTGTAMPEAHGPGDLLAGLARPSFVDALHAELATMATTLAPTIGVSARRVGVVADTHCVSPDGSDLPVEVLDASGGCDLILHCGDVSSLGTLDRLATLAPVLSVRSAIDPPADGARVHEGPILVRAGHTLIGMSPDLPDPMTPSDLFGTDVDIVLTGTSHVPQVTRSGSTLLVNPGSPTIPLSSSGPTVAVIELDGPRSTVQIIHLPRRQP